MIFSPYRPIASASLASTLRIFLPSTTASGVSTSITRRHFQINAVLPAGERARQTTLRNEVKRTPAVRLQFQRPLDLSRISLARQKEPVSISPVPNIRRQHTIEVEATSQQQDEKSPARHRRVTEGKVGRTSTTDLQIAPKKNPKPTRPIPILRLSGDSVIKHDIKDGSLAPQTEPAASLSVPHVRKRKSKKQATGRQSSQGFVHKSFCELPESSLASPAWLGFLEKSDLLRTGVRQIYKDWQYLTGLTDGEARTSASNLVRKAWKYQEGIFQGFLQHPRDRTLKAFNNRNPNEQFTEFAQFHHGDLDKARLEYEWLVEFRQAVYASQRLSLITDVRRRIALLEEARQIDELLALLIGPCQTLNDAKLELKWLQEHVESAMEDAVDNRGHDARLKLKKLCERRFAGEPLQYLLGTAYFGDLKLQCRPGVLIPREDTARIVSRMLQSISQAAGPLPKKLRILDLCSGSGCISLLLAHSFPYVEAGKLGTEQLEIVGVDISDEAIELANVNQKFVLGQVTPETLPQAVEAIQRIKFIKADVLSLDSSNPRLQDVLGAEPFDIVISNPPYISSKALESMASLSVRKYEPRSALVPPKPLRTTSGEEQADLFYSKILQITRDVGAQAVSLETGNLGQAWRVARLFRANKMNPKVPLSVYKSEKEIIMDEAWSMPIIPKERSDSQVETSDSRHIQPSVWSYIRQGPFRPRDEAQTM